MDRTQCAAYASTGARCTNAAASNSVYCAVHAEWVQKPSLKQNGTPDDATPHKGGPAGKGSLPSGAPPDGGSSPELNMLRQEVDSLLREIHAYRVRFGTDPITPALLVRLINGTIGKRFPDPAPELLEDVERNLQATSFADLADREVLQGMALLTYYSLQVQTEPFIKPVSEALRRLPGYTTMDEMRKRMAGRPLADLAGSDVWTDIWHQISYSALTKVDEILQEYVENN